MIQIKRLHLPGSVPILSRDYVAKVVLMGISFRRLWCQHLVDMEICSDLYFVIQNERNTKY